MDLAWLLGDYTGDALCDLHSRFPCPPEEEEPGGEMMLSGEQLAASAEVSAGSVANAVAALGFPSVDAYLTWCVEADPEAAENVLLTVWTLHTQSQWGGEQ